MVHYCDFYVVFSEGVSMKRKAKNKIKPKKNYILRIAIAVFFIFILATIVNQQIKIQQRRSELEEVSNQLQTVRMKNIDLEKKSELAEEASKLTVTEIENPVENSKNQKQSEEQKECEDYLRQEALRLGYAKSGVRVFQNIAGN